MPAAHRRARRSRLRTPPPEPTAQPQKRRSRRADPSSAPSRFPARDNIDPQYSAIVNMGEPLRTTPGPADGLFATSFARAVWPPSNRASNHENSVLPGGEFATRQPYPATVRMPVIHRRDKSMNGAAIIAEILRREGTQFLSCYPRNPLIEACAALNIRPILCRQERVGVG